MPLFTPSLSSHWVGLVTPVPAGIARPLVESLRNEVVCREHDIAELRARPAGGPARLRRGGAAGPAADPRRRRGHPLVVGVGARRAQRPAAHRPRLGRRQPLRRRAHPRAPPPRPSALWRVVEGIGGDTGWYSFPLAWAVRGRLDRLVGGVGLRRGRRDPRRLYVGDALDFWRVEEREAGRLLRLRAEMRLPGLAWLEFHVEHGGAGRTAATVLRQRATFAPRGLAGHLYWWAIAAFHGIVFGGMVRSIGPRRRGRRPRPAPRRPPEPAQ